MRASFMGKALSRADKLTKDQLLSLFKELLASNERLEAALQSMFDGILVCNLDHVPVLINKSAERILRIQNPESQAPLWQSIADEELKDFFYKALTSEETILGEEFALQSSSGTRIIAISLSALLSEDKIAGTIIHVEDIRKEEKGTQLRRAESLAALTTWPREWHTRSTTPWFQSTASNFWKSC